jgi:hypothetical protein
VLPDSHYSPKISSDKDEIIDEYGADVDAAGKVNSVSLGGQLALETGSSLVYTCQVKMAGDAPTATEYDLVYTNYLQFLPDAYRVIPMNLQADINLKTINHVNLMSTPEERGERVTLLGVDHSSMDVTDVINNVGGYAESVKNERVCVIYPDKVTRVLSDGNSYTLTAPYICAALAGWKSGQPVSQPYTHAEITCFDKLVGIDMRRTEKNKLAEKGVMVLEQEGGQGTPIAVRHGLTTDMSNLQSKEASVVEIGDYAAKFYRSGLKQYVGTHNVTTDLITKVKGSTNTLTNVLIKKDIALVGSKILQLYQDADNPDTLILKISLKVPYPCNTIEITLYLD